MTTGIYIMQFASGAQYIGKSIDVEKRWEQHVSKMQKGEAAKAIQQEYNSCGQPVFAVIKECHPDHLDVLEPLFIEAFIKQENCLNTSVPEIYFRPSKEDLPTINDDDKIFNKSTLEHIRELKHLRKLIDSRNSKVQEQKHEIADLKFDKERIIREYNEKFSNLDFGEEYNLRLKSLKEENNGLYGVIEKIRTELEKEKAKKWWQKLLGL